VGSLFGRWRIWRICCIMRLSEERIGRWEDRRIALITCSHFINWNADDADWAD